MSSDLWTAWKPKTPESNKSVGEFDIVPWFGGALGAVGGAPYFVSICNFSLNTLIRACFLLTHTLTCLMRLNRSGHLGESFSQRRNKELLQGAPLWLWHRLTSGRK
jgi:hypothetical protein